MFTGLDEIQSVPKDNPAYQTGMIDVHDRASLLQINMMDTTPFMYESCKYDV